MNLIIVYFVISLATYELYQCGVLNDLEAITLSQLVRIKIVYKQLY